MFRACMGYAPVGLRGTVGRSAAPCLAHGGGGVAGLGAARHSEPRGVGSVVPLPSLHGHKAGASRWLCGSYMCCSGWCGRSSLRQRSNIYLSTASSHNVLQVHCT